MPHTNQHTAQLELLQRRVVRQQRQQSPQRRLLQLAVCRAGDAGKRMHTTVPRAYILTMLLSERGLTTRSSSR